MAAAGPDERGRCRAHNEPWEYCEHSPPRGVRYPQSGDDDTGVAPVPSPRTSGGASEHPGVRPEEVAPEALEVPETPQPEVVAKPKSKAKAKLLRMQLAQAAQEPKLNSA